MSSGCQKCDDYAEAVARINAEPRRIIMFVATYTQPNERYIAREADGDNLSAVWAAMPASGLQKVQYVYNHRNIGRDGKPGAHYKGGGGADWYWMFREFDGCLVIAYDDTNSILQHREYVDETVFSILRRRYGAERQMVKDGKWTSPANIDRINREPAPWQ